MISKELGILIGRGYALAKEQHSEYLTVEHIFISMLNDPLCSKMLQELGLDVDQALIDTNEYLIKHLIKTKKISESNPVETVAVSKIFTDMLMHAESSGKTSVNYGDLLASLLSYEESFSYHYLTSHDITRLDVLEYITENNDEIENESKPSTDKKSLLAEHSENLTEKARNGETDPLVGRENEIDEIIRILARKRKNNPLLVGEPGVGKTAIVEGLAQKIINGEVPDFLKEKNIYSINMSSVVAGTKYRGEFEKRLKEIIEELVSNDNNILLIDEIHNIIGTGSTTGSLDAAGILKPILNGNKLKCIGTTTYHDFKKHLDKEKGLIRRFEKIDINEPNIEETITILIGLKNQFENFHGVKIEDDAIPAAVDLSVKYMNNKFLPDKAIDIIDDACAHVKINDKNGRICSAVISKIVSNRLAIPEQNLETEDKMLMKNLANKLKSRIFGQDKAINIVTDCIKRNRAGLGNEEKPIGSFLFTGPSGVGKTALAREIAKTLNIHFERFDMSEYMEKHTVARLIGAPAGYVGYDEGGLLTEAVRKHTHAVLLLDEIEKAHNDVLNILLQVMDSASLTDTTGIKVDFKNIILIMTSNLGSKEMGRIGFVKSDGFQTSTAVNKFFSPEFRNRLDSIVEFSQLNHEIMLSIVDKFIGELKFTLKKKKIELTITNEAREKLSTLGYSDSLGARPMERVIAQKVRDRLTDEILFGKLVNGGLVEVDLTDNEIDVRIKD
ncbi:MAG: AAA family ATPase [Candidatus Delongbacteria bacterium]|nr:AAA family ATPase [Candidatus Delongbacteria bacterium]MBN2835344.1 AAA family ATPase [Candidatus Delongbacteria bacterium]